MENDVSNNYKSNVLSKYVSDYTYSKISPPPSCFTFGTVNARSLMNKVTQIYDLLVSENLDLLLITETWLADDVLEVEHCLNKCMPVDYFYFYQSRSGKKGGGIAVIIRKSKAFKAQQIKVGTTQASMESLQIRLAFTSGIKIDIIGIYRPPNLPYTLFLEELYDVWETFITDEKSDDIIFLGDFNFRMDQTHESPVKQFNDLLHECGIHQYVDQPTHTKGHILDLIIAQEETHIVHEVKLSKIVTSDHSAVIVTSNLSTDSTTAPLKKNIQFREWSTLDKNIFGVNILREFATQEYSSSYNVSHLFELYNTVLSNALNKCLPFKDKSVSIAYRPWFDKELYKLQSARRKSERYWRKSKSDRDKLDYENKAKEFAERETELKKLYFKRELNTTCSKTVFRKCSELFKGFKKPQQYPFSYNDNITANKFNHYFLDKISQLRKLLSTSGTVDVNIYQQGNFSWRTFRLIDETILKPIVLSLNTKHCGLDPMPTWLLKEMLPIFLPFIVHLVNVSLITGTFPDKAKISLVTPLLKSIRLTYEDFKNFRPISNLNFVSKIIEKVIAVKLYDYLDEHRLLHKCQSGFRPKHSCETALLMVMNDLLICRDKGTDTVLLMLDISSAFDTLSHDILLDILKNYLHIDNIVLSWFKSYLSNRFQHVQVKSAKSDMLSNKFGVPQGSILGPILFTIYMIPVYKMLDDKGLTFHSYADDTQIYFSCSNVTEAKCKVKDIIDTIGQLFAALKLKLNADKTNVLLFTNNANFGNLDLEGNGNCVLEFKDSARNLGFIIDNKLKLEAQVTNVCKLCYYYIKLISKEKECLDFDTLKKVITSYVLSRLNYCSLLYANLPEYLLYKLQKVQNCAARLLTKTPKRDHITPVIKSLHWLTVKQFIHYRYLLTVYNCINDTMPNYLCNLLTFYEPNVRLRSDNQFLLNIPRVNTKYGERSFAYLGPKFWNELPINLKLCPTIDVFKVRVRKFLLSV